MPAEDPSDHMRKPNADAFADTSDPAWEDAFPAPLNAAQAARWRAGHRRISPLAIVACQAILALLGGGILWGVGQDSAAIISWFYGAAAIALPAAGFAALVVRQPSLGVLVLGELGKLLVSVVLLALAPWMLGEVAWSMLLLAIVLTVNVYWVAPIWLARRRNV